LAVTLVFVFRYRKANDLFYHYNPDIYHRQSIRLRGYDYSKAGSYFVTVCTKDRECLFGEIRDNEIVLNDAGRMVLSTWDELPKYYSGVEIDAFVMMPNHIHGIIVITNDVMPDEKMYPPAAGLRSYVGAGLPCPNPDGVTKKGAGTAPLRRSLGQVVAYFKYQSTKSINQFSGTVGSRLWQCNYYEHIIRNEEELNQVREYVRNNPMQWALDEENPYGAKQKNYRKSDRKVLCRGIGMPCPSQIHK
jgi:REP element-mobilizing transposase RayT